ncbi:Predicted acetyltransferase, GNAT superfamily [Lentzea albidocapillata subsp. violacea]|uniref:Predicted acetyltransferase, GNAT superfamily n=1 Tax=Lentzea albidocapillata subsp. violacea TaxID=128104 RepID=A0A1G8QIC0_9PSEU|nr:GNAT family N-acetyltransferase [Lentzea albidocapillata]SDJ04343.1 Predicted acetyltransferase, GNAT superfamily [Lentzea albidocapillata subsp. violacea]
MMLVAQNVVVRRLTEYTELVATQRLYESIWRSNGNTPPVTAELLRAMTKAGSYVAGAFDGEDLIGACIGFCSPPNEGALHSHIAGVAADSRGRNVGYALKLHQRTWALERGLREVTWTFDPLVRRNAYFNLGKLGADAIEYLPDFYGLMHDDINAGGESDRLLVSWRVEAPEVVAACAGQPRVVSATGAVALGISEGGLPVRGTSTGTVALGLSAGGLPVRDTSTGTTVLVAVPPDIEALRVTNPAAATEWRHAVREVLGGLLASGARVTGFDRSGWYVVERSSS